MSGWWMALPSLEKGTAIKCLSKLFQSDEANFFWNTDSFNILRDNAIISVTGKTHLRIMP
jgi:hypothetical protein